jgi:hypothetical protein
MRRNTLLSTLCLLWIGTATLPAQTVPLTGSCQ